MTTEELTSKLREHNLAFNLAPVPETVDEWACDEFGMLLHKYGEHWDTSVCNTYVQSKDRSGSLEYCLPSIQDEILDWQRETNSWTV